MFRIVECPEIVSAYVYAMLFIFILTVLVRLIVKRVRVVRLIQKVPGPSSKPIIGNVDTIAAYYLFDKGVNANQVLFQLLNGYTQVYEKERIYRFWCATRPVVMLYKPESIEAVLTSNSLIDKSAEYDMLHPWLGTGLLTSSGSKWRSRRKLLTPAFHFRILEQFLPVLNEQSGILVNRLRSLSSEGKIINILDPITLCTLDIICETSMGTRINAQKNLNSDYVRSIYEVGETFVARMMRPWLLSDTIFYWTSIGQRFRKGLDTLHGFTRKVIKERKEEMLSSMKTDPNANITSELGSKSKRAFLDLLLDIHLSDPASITEEEIREEVDTIMFEGHDTTAMALSWSLYLVGLDPEVQSKIHEELESIFGDDSTRPVTRSDLVQMKYLECVIKESLRLFPSVPFVGREIFEDTVINGFTIPSGTTVCLLFYMLHRNAEVFPIPERFDPDRFLPENSLHRHPFAYLPFSAGARNCIGQKFAMMEEKSVLSAIFRNFTVQSMDERDVVHPIAEMVTRPDRAIRMKFIPKET